jgi:hypothetical protein
MVRMDTSISPEELRKYQSADIDFVSGVTCEDTSSWQSDPV